MSKNECILKFTDYSVDKLIFEKNKSYKETDDEDVGINPEISNNIEKADENKYYVSLGIKIEEEFLPFKIDVSITGLFFFKDDNPDEDLINKNAFAILFPYLRSLVTTLTANANVQPMILPPINVVSYLDEIKEKEEQQKQE